MSNRSYFGVTVLGLAAAAVMALTPAKASAQDRIDLGDDSSFELEDSALNIGSGNAWNFSLDIDTTDPAALDALSDRIDAAATASADAHSSLQATFDASIASVAGDLGSLDASLSARISGVSTTLGQYDARQTQFSAELTRYGSLVDALQTRASSIDASEQNALFTALFNHLDGDYGMTAARDNRDTLCEAADVADAEFTAALDTCMTREEGESNEDFALRMVSFYETGLAANLAAQNSCTEAGSAYLAAQSDAIEAVLDGGNVRLYAGAGLTVADEVRGAAEVGVCTDVAGPLEVCARATYAPTRTTDTDGVNETTESGATITGVESTERTDYGSFGVDAVLSITDGFSIFGGGGFTLFNTSYSRNAEIANDVLSGPANDLASDRFGVGGEVRAGVTGRIEDVCVSGVGMYRPAAEAGAGLVLFSYCPDTQ